MATFVSSLPKLIGSTNVALSCLIPKYAAAPRPRLRWLARKAPPGVPMIRDPLSIRTSATAAVRVAAAVPLASDAEASDALGLWILVVLQRLGELPGRSLRSPIDGGAQNVLDTSKSGTGQ